jgi:hypothetical protein
MSAEIEADTLALHSGIVDMLAKHPLYGLRDFSDELAMAKVAENLWPCDKITDIRKVIEAAREAGHEGGRPDG